MPTARLTPAIAARYAALPVLFAVYGKYAQAVLCGIHPPWKSRLFACDMSPRNDMALKPRIKSIYFGASKTGKSSYFVVFIVGIG